MRKWPIVPAVLVMILLAFAGCEGESPTEPPRGGGSGGGSTPPPTSASITVAVSNPTPLVGSTSTITANVTQGGQPVPNGTAVEFSTSLGTFAETNTASAIRTTTGGSASVVLTSADPGTAVVTVRVNNASAVAQVTFQQQTTQPPSDTAPAITSISPSTGKPEGGDLVIISGRNFSAPVRVLFGTTPATVVSQTANEIRVLTPAANLLASEQAREVTVTVISEAGTPGEERATGGPFRYERQILTPNIFHVSPSSGPNEGNTRVTVFGEGFQSPVKVFFGTAGSPGASLTDQVEAEVQQVSFGQIIVMTPPALGLGAPLANQQVAVRVLNINSNTDDVEPNAFRYGPEMRITAVGPTTVSAITSTRVRIDGWGFDDPVAVTLGGIAALPISVSGTQIIVQTAIPLIQNCSVVGAEDEVSVTNIEDGTTATAEGVEFTYVVPDATIVAVTPNTAQPGNPITVSVANAGGGPARFQLGGATVLPGAPTVAGGITTYPLIIPSNIEFETEDCQTVVDGFTVTGERFIPSNVDVRFENRATGCSDQLAEALTVNPTDATCRVLPARASVTPASLTVTTTAGTPVTSPSVTVENSGDAPLTLAIVEQADPDNVFAILSNTCPAQLAGGSNCTFTVRYSPAVAGSNTAAYLVDTNVNDVSVTVQGTANP